MTDGTRVAVVTGAASGIGRATALRLAADGVAVACVDIDQDGAARTAQQIGAAAQPVVCDITDPDAVAAMIGDVAAERGRLDIVANVAGWGGAQRVEELDTDTWDRTLAVNLTGTFLVCQAALPHLIETRGTIVNVASVAALRGTAYAAAYAASKGGVVALTRALAVELADRGVRVNCVCPGGVDTPMVERFRLPSGAAAPTGVASRSRSRLAPPEEIAATIAYLISEGAAGVNGATLVVDGGASAHPA